MDDSPNHPNPDEDRCAAPANLDYEVLRLIGRGGYGEVWLVRDQAGRHLACKVIYRESFENERPYEREFEGIKKFEPVSQASESQVNILHVGRRDEAGYFYYVMELADDAVAGRPFVAEDYVPRTLQGELKRRGRLPVEECLRIGLSLSAALENLHGHGLIHRDIKPGNIIFVNGVPKLADIGLVSDRDVTVSYVGTEGYIPPEGPGSAAADVYGLGKVLYEISTGKDRLEFPELPTDLGEAAARETLLELNAMVLKACESDVRGRYQSAEELHADLAWLSSGRSVRGRRRQERRRAAVMKLVLVAAVIGAVAVAGYFGWQKWQVRNGAMAPPVEAIGPDAYPRNVEASAALASVCIRTGFEAIGLDDYARAEELAHEAQAAARSALKPHLISEAAFLDGEVSRGKNAGEAVRPFVKTLKEKPDDAEANLQVGKFFCLVKNDWRAGLPMLARGSDEAMRAAANMELQAAAEASVGDAWWSLAEKAADNDKVGFQRRARTWYLKAMAKSREPESSGARMKWRERIETVRSPAAQMHIVSRVGNAQHIEIYPDAVHWRSEGLSRGNQINQLIVGDLKGKGLTRVIENCGATRLYPEAVDFSTAQLTIDRKAKRRGNAKLDTFPDHVTLTLTDRPAGTSELDLTVTFGEPP